MFFGIDPKENFIDMLETQKKLISGVETVVNLDAVKPGVSEKELIYSEDKMRLFRYTPTGEVTVDTPLLIIYALVNKETMMDLEEENSFVKRLMNQGIEVYIIDWGYPTIDDKYITMEDYIDGYIDRSVDAIREKTGSDKVNILGVCQGGTFSLIYTSLYQEKVKNLITMVTPVDFDIDTGLLFAWSKYLDIDGMVEAYNGLIPGEFMNDSFMTLQPFALNFTKYIDLVGQLDDIENVTNFLRMENWIFDSPAQVGATISRFVNDLYKENKLAKGEFYLGDKHVDLKNITAPLLNVYASKDHIVPPEASKPIPNLVGSSDVEDHEIPTGHIGMYVSRRARDIVSPLISDWLKERDQ